MDMVPLTSKQFRHSHLRWIADQWKTDGRSLAALAAHLDMSPSYLGQLLNWNRQIGDKTARKIEQKMGWKEGSMDSFRASTTSASDAAPAKVSLPATRSGYVRFPQLEGYAGMGRGDYMGDYPEIVQWVEVTREWAAQKLAGVPHESVRVITGRGHSMRGVFDDGDLVFVDSSVKQFDSDAAYVFRWDGRVQIKRLQFIGKGRLRILSANPDYPPLEVEAKDIEIGGRAIAAWTLRDL